VGRVDDVSVAGTDLIEARNTVFMGLFALKWGVACS